MVQPRRVAFCQWSIALAALTLFGNEHSAIAEIVLEPIALSYRAPDVCPSFEQFLAEIERSTPRLRLARVGETARRFEVVIEAGGTEGHLALEGGSGGERAVNGADCRAVAELLAFAVALAADPEAQPAEPAGAVAALPSLHSSPPAKAVPSPSPSPAPAPVAVQARSGAPSPGVRPRWQWSVAGAGFATGASEPAITWGGGAFGELGLNSVAWAPRLRLGANYAQQTLEVASPPGSVALRTVFLNFEACSGALRRGALTFLPCLRAQGGTRDAKGQDPLPRHEEVLRGFLDLGAAGHLRLRFVSPAFVELGAAVMFPTVRDQVKVLSGPLVYEVPPVGMVGEVALGVEFGDQN